MKALKYLLITCALLIPVLVCVGFIHRYAVNGLWFDEWSLVPYLQQFDLGKLNLGELFQYQHNEHKHFIPALLLILVAHFTKYDGIILQYVGLAIMVITTIVLMAMTWQRVKGRPFAWLFLLPVSLVPLSLRQWENLITCYPYDPLCVSLFFVLTVFLLDNLAEGRHTYWKFAGAMVTAFCCTYSFGNGLLVCPIGFLQLFSYLGFVQGKERKTIRRLAIVWGIASIFLVSYYLITYHWPINSSRHLLFSYIFKEPAPYLWQFIVGLAGSMFDYDAQAFEAGLIMAFLGIISLVLAMSKSISWSKQLIAPIALMGYGFISTCVIFFARAHTAYNAVLSSRYAAITGVGLVGFYLFQITVLSNLPKSHGDQKSKPARLLTTITCAALVVLMLGGFIASFHEGRAAGQCMKSRHLIAAEKLLHYRSQSDESLKDIVPFPNLVRTFAPYLESKGYSVFREQ